MNTAIRQAVDSEKKVWARPVLTRLDVKETAGKPQGCQNDKTFPGANLCSAS
jgi:hypothetical protein